MGRLIIILSFICSLVLSERLSAQPLPRGIFIEDITTELSNGMLDIHFTMKASGLRIPDNDQLILSFAVENDNRRMILPPVVYSGGKRYRYERRRTILSGSFEGEAYAIYRRVRRSRNYRTNYTLTIPFDRWMQTAGLTYHALGDTDMGGGVLLANVVLTQSDQWAPDSLLFPRLVSFLIPGTTEKTGVSTLELHIGYPRGATDVRPDFGENRKELARVDSLVRRLLDNDMIRIDRVNIRGYASPDGSYAANEKTSRERSESFKRYLTRTYPNNSPIQGAVTSWVAEDWGTLARLIEADNKVAQKQDVLAIVRDPSIDSDTKERMLQSIVWWSQNYGILLYELYPKLRRIELELAYTIHRLDGAQVEKVLHSDPDMLSLEEIYRVAALHEPGSYGYREAYRIAARQYPDDVIACNNMAAMLLQEGNADAAWPYLQKIGESPYTYINFGAYYYVKGNKEKAVEYFEKAKQAGNPQGEYNLSLVND